jgi:1H-pyrrole-2-carbonyl-[peptidyl-carrier protein] chlorinase
MTSTNGTNGSSPAADFDVGIIGGGPGGAATAAYLARAGLRPIVFEREHFPREHVGESLVPSSTRVFRELDFIDQMDLAGFPRKYGAAWTASDQGAVYQHGWDGLEADHHAAISFAEREQPGVGLKHTWHVDRGKFDQLLLEHAEKFGATVRFGTSVTDVDFEPELPRIEHRTNGHTETTSVRMVVDASGRKTFLGSKKGLRVRDDVFDQYAVHTWFKDYDRSRLADGKNQDNFIFVHFLPISNSWIWQIPITEEITSIGVVTQKKNFAKSRESREEFFWSCLESRPELASGLRAAEQLRPLKEEGDYSYAMKEISGDRFVLVGDAARFVDPIFSTGVSIALNSARFASRDIIQAFETGNLGKESFATFESTMRLGVRNWYRFIALYYRLNVLFTAFIQHPEYRLDVLKLLQGDVYDEAEPEVLGRMREIVSTVENNPEHIWHRSLGTLRVGELSSTF